MKRSLSTFAIVTLLLCGLSFPIAAQDPVPDAMPYAPPLGSPEYGPVDQGYGMPADVTAGSMMEAEAQYADGEYGDCGNCGDCDSCRRRPGIYGGWAGFDAMLLWNKGRNVPPLVTSSDPGTPRADAGVLGFSSTNVLFGGENIGTDPQAAGRVSAGIWIDPCQNTGIGGRFWAIEGDRTRFDQQTDGSLILGRPFFDVSLAEQNALLIGFPGQLSGNVHVRTENDALGTDLFGRFRMTDTTRNRIDLIMGYNFVRIDDDLSITNTTNIIDPGSILFGARFNNFDQFRTRNEFHGGEIGVMGERCNGRVKISYLGKVSYGNVRQEFDIAGNTAITLGGTTNLNGGLLTQTSNIGSYVRNRSMFIPEFNMNLHVSVTQRLDLSVGYSFIYFTNVALAGDQIDTRVNLTQQSGPLVGAARPLPLLADTDFWLQGLNFGANYRF